MKQSDDMPGWVWLLVIVMFIVLFIVWLPTAGIFGKAELNTTEDRKAAAGFLLFAGLWGLAIVFLLVYAITKHFRKPPK